jgi:hypothetical protein
MISLKRAGIAGAIASAVALMGAALPAQAVTAPAWRQVFSKHYGPSTDYSAFNAVVATGKTAAWAFGGTDQSGGSGNMQKPVVVGTTNGTTWTAATLPSGLTGWFEAASAPAPNDIWAVTFSGGSVVHYDGQHWKLAHHIAGAGELTGVTALSPTNVWVFGGPGEDNGLGTWHYNGAMWTQVKTGVGAALEYGSALSAHDIWAIGSSAAPEDIVTRYNGSSWQPASTTGLPSGQWQFTAIRAFSDSNVWVTADLFTNNANTTSLLHFNGSKWTVYPLPWAAPSGGSNFLKFTLAPDGAGGLWFMGGVDQSGPGNDFSQTFYVIHRTASGSWTRTVTGSFKDTSSGFSPTGADLGGLASIPGTKSLWGAGFTESKTVGGNAVIWAYGAV